ncbi:MAG: Stp1/IreP family PP2C-type Ser/Thr phosphatase [Thermoanaerobaculia bacterium]
MEVKAVGVTDTGRQRQHNEDFFLVQPEVKLFLVADGMGGHAAGEIASRIAGESIAEFIRTSLDEDGTWPHAYDEHLKPGTNRLLAAVKVANSRVIEAMRKDARLRGMGTTVVASLLEGETMSLAHVGDSRGYHIRGSQLKRITNDHSWVFEQVQAGMLTEAEAEHHPLRNVITRALGGALTVVPEASEVAIEKGDLFLLCSDGLTGMVPEDEILRLLVEHPNLDEAAEKLIAMANARGGNDNITVVLVRAE